MRQPIFLIDAFGAFISGMFLILVTCFEPLFGVSIVVAKKIIFIPILIVLYNIIVYQFTTFNWKKSLKILAIANLLYCILTLYIVYDNFVNLTKLGIIYFSIEIVIILLLVQYELKIANKTT